MSTLPSKRPVRPHGLVRIGVPLVVIGTILTLLLSQATFLSKEDANASAAGFSPDAYVDDVWVSKVVPAGQEDSIDLHTLLTDLANDPAGTEERLGHKGSTGNYSYLVKGTGRVSLGQPGFVQVTDSTLPPETVVMIATKPSTSTALRDALGFITVSEFQTQMQYADVATALNSRSATSAFGSDMPETLDGSEVTFVGAVTIFVPNAITVVPIEMLKS